MDNSKFILDSRTIKMLIPLIVLLLGRLWIEISNEDVNSILDAVLVARDAIAALILVVCAMYYRYIAKDTLRVQKKDPVELLSDIWIWE